jgi:hypothetical protein
VFVLKEDAKITYSEREGANAYLQSDLVEVDIVVLITESIPANNAEWVDKMENGRKACYISCAFESSGCHFMRDNCLWWQERKRSLGL